MQEKNTECIPNSTVQKKKSCKNIKWVILVLRRRKNSQIYYQN